MPYLAGESRRRADSQLSSSIKRSRLELEIALPCGEIVGILREDRVCLWCVVCLWYARSWVFLLNALLKDASRDGRY